MPYLKEKALSRVDAARLAQFLALAGTASLIPFYIQMQWLSGPLVNAVLIIALFLVGIRSALVLCLIPSLMALAGGFLPAVMAPVLPFVMMGNMILVLVIDWFYNNIKENARGYWIGLALGASAKFLFLFLTTGIMAKLMVNQALAGKVAQMMSWPQLATAMTGGFIAWGVLKWLKRL